MPRSNVPIALSGDQRTQLERWLAASGTPQQVALRCRIILSLADGKTEVMIATENRVNRKTVRLWRERFRSQGLQGLWEIAPGRGRQKGYLRCGSYQTCDRRHVTIQAAREHALELPHDGRGAGDQQGDREQHLAQPQYQAASHPKFQVVTRSEVSGETHRRGRPISESSRQGDRDLC